MLLTVEKEGLKVSGLETAGRYAGYYGDAGSQATIIAATCVCTGLHKQIQNKELGVGTKADLCAINHL